MNSLIEVREQLNKINMDHDILNKALRDLKDSDRRGKRFRGF